MTTRFKLVLTKNMAYLLLLYLLYILQATPGLFTVWGVKPLLVLPAAICIAMREGDLTGGLLGAFAGILCDTSSFTSFGFNAIFFLLFCVGAAFAVMFLMQPTWVSATGLTALALFLRSVVEHFFLFVLWGYEDAPMLFLLKIFPHILWSCLWAPLLFWLTGKIYAYFYAQLED